MPILQRIRRSCTHYELHESWDVASGRHYLAGFCQSCQRVVDACAAIHGPCSLNKVGETLVVYTQHDGGRLGLPANSVVARWDFKQDKEIVVTERDRENHRRYDQTTFDQRRYL